MSAEWILGAAVLVALSLVVWFVVRRKRRPEADGEKIEEIVEILGQLAGEANKRRLQIHPVEGNERDLVLNELRALSEHFPSGIQADIEMIESLWDELNRQLEQFAEQSAQTTLQSSVLTNRSIKIADDINKLVSRIQISLRG